MKQRGRRIDWQTHMHLKKCYQKDTQTHLQGLLGGGLACMHALLVVLHSQELVHAWVPLLNIHAVHNALSAACLADVLVQLLCVLK